MDIIFHLLLIVGFIKYSVKATYCKGVRGIWLYSVVAGVIVIASYPLILNTNTDVFNRLLSEKKSVSNMAVLITIEAIFGMIISIGMLQNIFVVKPDKWIKVLKFLPGVLISGVVFYSELLLFRFLAGMEFHWIALIASTLWIVAVFALSMGIKYLLPIISTRYELKFLVNLLLLILAVLLNAGLADYNSSNYHTDVHFLKLLVFIVLAGLGFLIGWVLYKNKKLVHKILKIK